MMQIKKEETLFIEINGEHLEALRVIIGVAKDAIGKMEYVEHLKGQLQMLNKLIDET